jgi:2-phosphoglycerate kinase
MVARFYGQRTPMIILVFGAPSIGKSLIANHLAERLNVSNVLQTSIVESVMKEVDPKFSTTLRDFDMIEDPRELIEVFNQVPTISDE